MFRRRTTQAKLRLGLLVSGLLLVATSLAPSLAFAAMPQPSHTAAVAVPPLTVSASIADTCSRSFFGLEPWFAFLPDADFDGSGKDKCNIRCFNLLGKGAHKSNRCGNSRSDVPLVLAAVVDDLLRLAGIVAVGFTIYGAFQFVASQGSPEATARAQTTIINSLLGLAIASIAVVAVAYLGNHIGGAPNPGGTVNPGELPQTAANQSTIKTIIEVALNTIGALALLMIVVSGLRYITSAGDSQKAASARNGIIYALVGLMIAATAQGIVAFVGNRL